MNVVSFPRPLGALKLDTGAPIEAVPGVTRCRDERTEQPRGRVMVVDADADVRDLLVSALVEVGFEVWHTASNVDFIEWLRVSVERQFAPLDIVLLDAGSPSSEGLELLRDLRGAGWQTPVVLLAACGDFVTLDAAARIERTDVLSQPLDGDALFATLARRLSLAFAV